MPPQTPKLPPRTGARAFIAVIAARSGMLVFYALVGEDVVGAGL